MAISPTQLDAFSDLPATYAASLEDLTWNFIVELLSKYGSVKDPQDIDTNAWKQRMLTQAPQMRTFFQKQSAAGFKASRHAVRQSLAKAPLEDQQAANDWLGGLRQKKLLGTPKNLKQAHGVSKLIASAQNKTDEYLRMARRNMADNAYAGYRKIVTDAALYAKNGKEPRKALAMALEQSAKQGVPALIDRAGKSWQPDVYMRLVVNNQVQQLSNQVSVQRAKDYGTKVIISSHAGCRPTHQQYQGQIYSVDGDTSEYPDLYEATNYGSAGGLCGINCHHYPMPYVPGYGHPDFVELDPEENNRQYSLRQEQRRLERNVRAAKRKQVAAEKFDDPAGIAAARREVTAKQKAVREFVGKHPKELTRDYGREKIMGLKRAERTTKRAMSRKTLAKTVEAVKKPSVKLTPQSPKMLMKDVEIGKPMTVEKADRTNANPNYNGTPEMNERLSAANREFAKIKLKFDSAQDAMNAAKNVARRSSSEYAKQRYREAIQARNDLVDKYNAAVKAVKNAEKPMKPYRVNCQRCAPAYELRRRGYNVVALPNSGGSREVVYDIPENMWRDKDGNVSRAERLLTKTNRGVTGALMQEMKPGERGTIDWCWSGHNEGHIINVERTEDGILLVDAQSGKTATSFEEYMGSNKFRTSWNRRPYGVNYNRVDDKYIDLENIGVIVKKAGD